MVNDHGHGYRSSVMVIGHQSSIIGHRSLVIDHRSWSWSWSWSSVIGQVEGEVSESERAAAGRLQQGLGQPGVQICKSGATWCWCEIVEIQTHKKETGNSADCRRIIICCLMFLSCIDTSCICSIALKQLYIILYHWHFSGLQRRGTGSCVFVCDRGGFDLGFEITNLFCFDLGV